MTTHTVTNELRRQLIDLKSSSSSKIIELEKQVEILNSKLIESDKRLQQKIKEQSILYQQFKGTKEKLQELERDHQELKSTSQLKMLKLEGQVDRLRDEKQLIEKDWESERARQEMEISRLRSVQQTRIEHTPKRIRLEETQPIHTPLNYAAGQSVKPMGASISTKIDTKELELLKSLHSQAQSTILSLEKQNAALLRNLEYYKGMYENSQKLKEQIKSLESRTVLLDQKRAENSMLELKIVELEKERKQWFSVCQEEGLTPQTVFQRIGQLKKVEKGLLDKIKELENEIQGHKDGHVQVSSVIEEQKTKHVELTLHIRELKSQMQRFEMKNRVVLNENTRLKELIASYDTERKMDGDDHILYRRISDLETSLGEYKSLLQELETQIQSLQLQKDQNVQKIEELEKERDGLLVWKSQVLESIGYDPTTTRVVCLAQNPSTYTRIDTTQIDTNLATNTKELESLKSELASREKTITRLKQVFAEKVQEYRLFVKSLLGYEVEMGMDGKSCTLKPHRQGLSGDADIVFYYWTEGDEKNVKVMGGGTKEIEMMLKKYVSKHGDFPSFFASVLLT